MKTFMQKVLNFASKCNCRGCRPFIGTVHSHVAAYLRSVIGTVHSQVAAYLRSALRVTSTEPGDLSRLADVVDGASSAVPEFNVFDDVQVVAGMAPSLFYREILATHVSRKGAITL